MLQPLPLNAPFKNFGHLNFVVRFETDARTNRLPGGTPCSTLPSHKPSKPSRHSPFVVPHGEIVPQEAILEVKTMRGNQNPVMPLRQTWPFYKWEDIAPQLLLAGIHKVCTGIHENGVFYTVEEHDIDHRWLYTALRANLVTVFQIYVLSASLHACQW